MKESTSRQKIKKLLEIPGNIDIEAVSAELEEMELAEALDTPELYSSELDNR